MATASGPEDIDIVRWPISGMLDKEPYRFEFFQAVRLLSRMYPQRDVAGRLTTPRKKWCASRRIPMRRFPQARFSRSTAPRVLR
jgi:hypothetical protein